jgi:hypothetical protein
VAVVVVAFGAVVAVVGAGAVAVAVAVALFPSTLVHHFYCFVDDISYVAVELGFEV